VAARRCIAALTATGVEVQWTPFVPGRGWGLGYAPALHETFYDAEGSAPEALVAHLVPEFLPLVRKRAPNSFLVAHTVWDTDRIPGHWVSCLDEADLIVVPSRFSAEAIRASAVSTPVEIVPHAAAPLDASSEPSWPELASDAFVFYTIGEWTERKAIGKTIEAYLRAFTARDRVLLIVKSSPRDRTRAAVARGSAGEGTSAWSLAALLASPRR
jgi:glycosyltransferase involved in cell wall biosynthesis